MITPELMDYIHAQKGRGMSDEDIKKELKETGWDDETINSAMSTASMAGHTDPTMPITQPHIVIPDMPAEHNTMTMPSEPQKKRSLLWLWILITVVVLVIVAGGYVSYAYYSPQDNLGRAFNNTSKIKSFSYDFNMQGSDNSNSSSGAIAGSGKISLQGSIDDNDTKNPKGQGTLTIVSDTSSQSNSADQLNISANYNLTIQLKYLNKIVYLNFKGLSDIIPEIGQFDNKWFSLDTSDLAGLAKNIPDVSSLTTPKNTSGGNASGASQTVTQDGQKIIDAYKKYSFFILKPKTFTDYIPFGGDLDYTYSVDLDQYKNFAVELSKTLSNSAMTPDLTSQLNAITSSGYAISGEIWMQKGTYYIDKMTINVTDGKGVALNGDLSITDVNQPVTITAPTGAQSLDDILKGFVNSFGSVSSSLNSSGSALPGLQ